MTPLLYFAYGSNLRSAQMRRLCPGHRFLAAARLADHRLAFTLHDEEWRGGVADVISAPGLEVWGALYRITPADLAALDAYEGFDPSDPAAGHAYLRRPVEVTTDDDKARQEAWCYFVNHPQAHVPPSGLYRRALLAGARERGLPPGYLGKLSLLLRESARSSHGRRGEVPDTDPQPGR